MTFLESRLCEAAAFPVFLNASRSTVSLGVHDEFGSKACTGKTDNAEKDIENAIPRVG